MNIHFMNQSITPIFRRYDIVYFEDTMNVDATTLYDN